MKAEVFRLKQAIVGIMVAVLPLALGVSATAQTGTPVPSLAALDDIMQQALQRYGVHGGALAVIKDGRLVFARGYGLGDVAARVPVQPESLFRWESMSKTVTAAAIMRLVEDGKLNLDAPVFNILNQYSPYNGRWGDGRLSGITVRQLLQHTAGWDRLVSSQADPVDGEGTVLAATATGSAFSAVHRHSDSLHARTAARFHPRYSLGVFALWIRTLGPGD